jgi:hypothetical protein
MLMTEALKKEIKRFQSRQRASVQHFKKELNKLTSDENYGILVRSGIWTKAGNLSSIYRTAKIK